MCIICFVRDYYLMAFLHLCIVYLAIVREAEVATNNYDFAIAYRMRKEFAVGAKSFDGPLRDDNGTLINHDDKEQQVEGTF